MASTDREKKVIRKANRDARVAALRDGRKQRAAVFTDRKKKASQKACRGKVDIRDYS